MAVCQRSTLAEQKLLVVGAAQSVEVNVLVDHKGTTDEALAELPAQLQALGCQSIKVKVRMKTCFLHHFSVSPLQCQSAFRN